MTYFRDASISEMMSPGRRELIAYLRVLDTREDPSLKLKDQAWQAVIMAALPHRRRRLWGLISYPTPYRQLIIGAATIVPEQAGHWAIRRGADRDTITSAYALIYGREFPRTR
jgi:hypothetical protein